MATAKKAPKAQTSEVNKAPESVKQSNNEGAYGDVSIVTSMRLKRRFVNGGYYASLYLPPEVYTNLNMIGIQLGVSWDEVVRGLIEQHQAYGSPTGELRKFIPALNG
ncbi:MAG: hypothetical protein V4577_19450 [Bacteroidota bacterium]